LRSRRAGEGEEEESGEECEAKEARWVRGGTPG